MRWTVGINNLQCVNSKCIIVDFHIEFYKVTMFVQSLRCCIWTFRLNPYTRLATKNSRTPSRQLWFDAFDLLLNLRGIGWSWPQGLRIPKETRNVGSTISFLLTTLQWVILDLIAFDSCHYVVQAMQSKSNVAGIFDASLPPLHRYARSTIMTILTGFTVYLGIDSQYYSSTIVAVAVFQQSPSIWPPPSDRPYLSTSLNQFWTARWHQSFRDIFIRIGGKPSSYLFGRVGGLLGAFFISGVLHDIGCWSLGRGTNIKGISEFFLMNGIGIILERVFKSITGKRVHGVAGWIWTHVWLLGWGGLLINAWFEHGLVECSFWPEHVRPAFYVHKLLFPNVL